MALDEAVVADLESVVGAEVVADLMSSYDADAVSLVAQIRKAFDANDATGVSRAAHTLKSTSETLGALALGKSCAEAERLGRGGELASAQLVEQIEAELVAVRAAIAARSK